MHVLRVTDSPFHDDIWDRDRDRFDELSADAQFRYAEFCGRTMTSSEHPLFRSAAQNSPEPRTLPLDLQARLARLGKTILGLGPNGD